MLSGDAAAFSHVEADGYWGAVRIAGQIRRLGYHYNQGVHALNAIAYYLKRNEADGRDALDVLVHAAEKLDAADEGVRAICEQLDSLVGKRFGYELFEPRKCFNLPDSTATGNLSK